jgi:O-acetyl-ADP-ribose deacetylase (regulator of RNase III)
MIHFIDLHDVRINEFKKWFAPYPNVTYTVGNVSNLPLENTAFVSAANSFLFMDGGIDKTYSRVMFPGVEKRAKTLLKQLDITTMLDRYYLPVGSAMTVPVGNTTSLIFAPTMFLPQNVANTNNAYHAFLAALCAFEKSGLPTLVCPPMCTGWGEMTDHVAAEQMHKAYQEFSGGFRPPQIMCADQPWCYITEDKDEEQPNYYENTEIMHIDLKDIVHKHSKI